MDSIDEYLEIPVRYYGSHPKGRRFHEPPSRHRQDDRPVAGGQIGHNEMEVYRALKEHFDPDHIMNPGGTLGLDLPEEQKRDLIHKK